ncbi:MAG: DNA-binding protein WhiA [Coriobacteriales bacterium]|jgi:DNA-binding protein WhiA|nr:DNA-binding protein WhiA [Coriobacteriales bacterium]
MSFTAEVKDELSRLIPEDVAARRAELSALVHIDGRLSGRYRLEIITERAPVARVIVRLFHSLYRLKTEVTTRRSVLHKSYSYLITLPAQNGLEEAIRDLGILTNNGLEMGVAERLVERSGCLIAYLRGAFLGGGFIANPREDAHFELSCGHEAFARGLTALLALSGISARVAQRRSNWIVYIKGAEPILEFLALVGAHRAVLTMENTRVTKSIRNDENRLVNAELANQKKSIEASLAQVRDIQLCIDQQGIESFPPALRELAELRLAHPDVSLRELGELARPPLSKSAVYHRVRRIEQIARECVAGGASGAPGSL